MTFGLNGQTMKQYVKSANEAFKKQDYYSALYFLGIIQEIDSTKINLQFKQAEAARHFNAYVLAEKRYQQVLESEVSKQYPMAIFWMATVQKMQGHYNDAIKGFNQYLVENPDSSQTKFKEANAQIKACYWAKELSKINDKDLEIIQLGEEVNSNYSEFGAVQYGDKLLFSSLKFELEKDKSIPPKKFSKILQLKDGAFEATTFDLGVSDKKAHTAHTAFNKEGDRLFFNICRYVDGNIIKCKLFYKDKIADTLWSKSVELPPYINLEKTTTTHPNIGYNETLKKAVLYFISDRAGGKGGMDIWYSFFDENGLPEVPKNLEAVNTEKDEYSPFFHTYSQTLYFSSAGRKSLGGFDIYKTEFKENKWQEIDHTGFPLNTSYNDIYFSLNEIGSEGYIASNRAGSKFLEKELTACCNDIFKAKFNSYPLDLQVLTFLRNRGLEEELTDVTVKVFELFDDAAKEVPYKIKSNGNQHFYKIKSNKKYRIIAEKDGYLPDEMEFETNNPASGEKIIKKVYLQPIKLHVLTFSGNLNTPLDKVSVSLTEIDENGIENNIELLELPIINSYFFPLKLKSKYRITAQKDGFDTVVKEFDTQNWLGRLSTLRKEVILTRSVTPFKLQTLKPFPLFFDNDYPNPKSLDTTTQFTFPLTLEEYKRKKGDFINGYAKGLSGEEKIIAEQKIENFFELEMDTSYQKFLAFTDAVLNRLQLGRSVNIKVQAYTSPLASSQYNLNLSKRRVSSMLNFYKSYKNGMMKKYVDSGKLTIKLVSYGETKAPEGISDNPNDRKNSVFGVGASRQRKVEIIEVRAERGN